jgi:hypothetical protein
MADIGLPIVSHGRQSHKLPTIIPGCRDVEFHHVDR